MSKICVIGYFNHGNLGDDMFEYALRKYIFNDPYLKIDVDFKNIDEITIGEVKEYKCIFFGPGDVINDYFMDRLKMLKNECLLLNIPIYALGVGIPFPSMIEGERGCQNLRTFDYMIYRNFTDKELLTQHIQKDRLHFSPDITWLIENDTKIHPGRIPGIEFSSKTSKKIGICLSRTMFNPDQPKYYSNIVDELGVFFAKLLIGDYDNNKKVRFFGKNKNKLSGCCNITKINYELYFVPFYCHPEGPAAKPLQDDRIINEEVCKSIYIHLTHFTGNEHIAQEIIEYTIHNLQDHPSYEHVTSLFSLFDIVIANRFHSHVFSAINCVPFVSIYTTRKVELFDKELEISQNDGSKINFEYKLDIDEKTDYPISLSSSILNKKFQSVLDNHSLFKQKLRYINNLNRVRIDRVKRIIKNLIYYKPVYIYSDEWYRTKTLKCAQRIKDFFVGVLDDINLNEVVNKNGILGKIINEKGLNNDENNLQITQIIVYTLLDERFTTYNYGLSQQIFENHYNFMESCKWILIHRSETNHPIFSKGDNDVSLLDNEIPFEQRNIEIISNYNLTSFHRSGWGFVTHHIKKLDTVHSSTYLNNELQSNELQSNELQSNELQSNELQSNELQSNELQSSNLAFDLYLDKTFGWDMEFLTSINVLPLKCKWAGIFHHTPTPDYGLYTIDRTFNNEIFIESLKWCTKLFVFSNRLKTWIENKLSEIFRDRVDIFPNIQVIVLTHPTEFISEKLTFTPTKLLNNNSRKLVQVGAWLRDTYAIYKVRAPNNYTKVALKGKGMGHYYIDEEKMEELECTILEMGNDEAGIITCQVHPTGLSINEKSIYPTKYIKIPEGGINGIESWKINKYVRGLVQTLREMHSEVVLMERLTNDEYDELLSQNVVFIKLVDGSAVNTVLECIVRNTPILVNRLPALEEYLGSSYPLFYNSLDEVYEILRNDNNIQKAYAYLKSLNKCKFRIDHFINNLIKHLN